MNKLDLKQQDLEVYTEYITYWNNVKKLGMWHKELEVYVEIIFTRIL